MKYNKGILFLVSGIIAIAASRILGESSEAYGFLIGYGYTAIVGGIAGLFIALVKNQKLRKRNETNS
ncbi:hypothetical protein [Pontibacter pamirensis]|uniref:hypothetical protein n=1 Tax=Pontibacter pamirensis TaxID=2562824 RepID=UPI00138A4CA8|nr:hypothetical protein [Pontibacter pamirensis]